MGEQDCPSDEVDLSLHFEGLSISIRRAPGPSGLARGRAALASHPISVGPSPLGPLAGAPAPCGPAGQLGSEPCSQHSPFSASQVPVRSGFLAGAVAPGSPECRRSAFAQAPAYPGSVAGAPAPRGLESRFAAASGSQHGPFSSAQVPAFPGSLAGAAAPGGPERHLPTGFSRQVHEPGPRPQRSSFETTAPSVPAASGSLAGAPAPSGLECRAALGSFPGPSGVGTAGQGGQETRAQILASFPPLPDHLRVLCEALTLSAGPTELRAQRAWTAGCWARAVLDSRVRTPNRTPPIQLAPRIYVVLRAPGLHCPAYFRSRRDYFAAIGSFEGRDSVSHAWPSEAEARVYVEAAGLAHPL